MPSVEFNEDARSSAMYQGQGYAPTNQSKMTTWLLSKGIIKDASQGPMVLLGIAILCLALTAVVIFKFIL